MKKPFVFTPENLLKNIKKLGGWSAFGLAETAIYYYHPKIEKIKDYTDRLNAMVKISGKMYWQDWIIKYHKEVGYTTEINSDNVNEF